MPRFTSLPTSEAVQKHGHGELHYASGDVFVGTWVDDHAVGQGVLNYADGKVRANSAGRPGMGLLACWPQRASAAAIY
jgi:hypothetical protein